MKKLQIFLVASAVIFGDCNVPAQEEVTPMEEEESTETAVMIPEATPTPTPSLDEPLLKAIAEGNLEDARRLLNEGASPNATIPHPVSDYWKQRYAKSKFECYILDEPGTSALMLACADKKRDFVNLLLEYGAARYQKTTHYKVFALQIAARNQDVETMMRLMDIKPDSEAGKSWIRVDLENQTASYWRENQLVVVTQISSGKKATPTPKGEYLVTDKLKNWKSTIFKVPMPYFLRLSCGDFGLHEGYVPDYPASHGCIRLPEENAKKFFKEVPIGTRVSIQ